MRYALAACVFCLLGIFPSIVVANSMCPATFKEYGVWSAAEAQGKLDSLIVQADACADEEVRAYQSGYICHRITRECSAGDRAKYGCAPGQITPKIRATLEMPVGGKMSLQTLTIPKCDEKGLRNAVSQSFSTGSLSPLQNYTSGVNKAVLTVKSGEVAGGREIIQQFVEKNTESQSTTGTGGSVSYSSNYAYEPAPQAQGSGSGALMSVLGSFASIVPRLFSKEESGSGGQGSSFTQTAPVYAPTSVPSVAFPVATLVVWPETAQKNGTIVVHWSSVGIQAKSPCRLSALDVRAEGRSGSQTVRVPENADAIDVTLSCKGVNGRVVDTSERVQVE